MHFPLPAVLPAGLKGFGDVLEGVLFQVTPPVGVPWVAFPVTVAVQVVEEFAGNEVGVQVTVNEATSALSVNDVCALEVDPVAVR